MAMRGLYASGVAVLTVLVVGCGSSSSSLTRSSNPAPSLNPTALTSLTSASSTASTAPSTPRPTCGAFCQQAGPAGGPHGCTHTCATCPTTGCLELLSSTAPVSGGTAQLKVRCAIAQQCSGALLILQPHHDSTTNDFPLPRRDWIAGSDIRVPARSSMFVSIGLTPRGVRLVNTASAGYPGEFYWDLKNYGDSFTGPNPFPPPIVRLLARP